MRLGRGKLITVDNEQYKVPAPVARFFNSGCKSAPAENALTTLASEVNLKKKGACLPCEFFSKRSQDTRKAYREITEIIRKDQQHHFYIKT